MYGDLWQNRRQWGDLKLGTTRKGMGSSSTLPQFSRRTAAPRRRYKTADARKRTATQPEMLETLAPYICTRRREPWKTNDTWTTSSLQSWMCSLRVLAQPLFATATKIPLEQNTITPIDVTNTSMTLRVPISRVMLCALSKASPDFCKCSMTSADCWTNRSPFFSAALRSD